MSLRLKPVPGYSGLFAGSDGSVWRYRNFTGKASRWNGWRQLAAHVNQEGYREVCVPRGEKWNRHLAVHAVVALAFHGERPAGLVITHLDGDKFNNAPTNLAYRTPRDNVLDKRTHGTMRRGDSHPASKLTDKQCLDVISRMRAGEFMTDLAKEYGVHVATLASLKSGRTRAHLQANLH